MRGIVKPAIEGSGTKVVRKQKKNFEEIYQEVLEIIEARQNNAMEALKRGESVKVLHRTYISSYKGYQTTSDFYSQQRCQLYKS